MKQTRILKNYVGGYDVEMELTFDCDEWKCAFGEVRIKVLDNNMYAGMDLDDKYRKISDEIKNQMFELIKKDIVKEASE